MSIFSDQQLAAAALADSYIQIILTQHPELLVPHAADSNEDGSPNAGSAMHQAQRITYFRQQLIAQLEGQPINMNLQED